MKTLAGLLLACALVAVAPLEHGAIVCAASKPNMIFIIADDLDTASMSQLPRLQSLLADHGVTLPIIS